MTSLRAHRFRLLAACTLLVPSLAFALPAAASPSCTVTQLTNNTILGQGNLQVDFSGNRIAFEASIVSPENPDGGTEVFILDRTTSTLRQVSHVNFPPDLARYPALSADGRRVAYQVDGSTAIDWFSVLYLHDLPTDSVTTLSPTNRSVLFSPALDGDGSRVAFRSPENLSGDNPFDRDEVVLYDASTAAFTQVTPIGGTINDPLRIDFAGNRVVFDSNENLTGDNPFGWIQLFLFDLAKGSLAQITPKDGFPNFNLPDLSGDGRRVVFGLDDQLSAYVVASKTIVPLLEGVVASTLATNFNGTRTAFFAAADLTGGNPDQSMEIFLFDSTSGEVIQLTDTDFNSSFNVAINGPGNVVVYLSNGNPVGLNPDRSTELFAAECPPGPPRPDTPPLTSPDLPGFAFHVQFSTGDGFVREGHQEPACIPETVCVSGALPGRSEVFLRVVGPRPNGFLWPTLVKFSTSTVDVWVEQLATGLVRHYRLSGAAPGKDELPGLFDRHGYLLPPDAEVGASTASSRASEPAPPMGGVFTSEHFPDFRFRARITASGKAQEVRKEAACIEETLCLSGAIPGRSEVFVRIVGPKPNGRLWPTIVKFTTSAVEVWIEQISTGEQKYYRIEGAAPGKDDLTGLFDRDGFAP